MPKINVVIAHEQSPQEVIEKVKPALEKTVSDFQGRDFEIDWSDTSAKFRFKSMAFTITGAMQIDEKQVSVELDLPFAAMMFKEKARQAITKNITRALEA
ncbi:MAG: polyhydroxyalkanoic acid system family protein [Planctomycetes bacterium]|nr:polyhydroxyalkanoic acid system family protein [Planctomycetota bacterium]